MSSFAKKIRKKKNARNFENAFRKELTENAKLDLKARFAVAFADIKQDKYNSGLRRGTIDDLLTIWAYTLNRDYRYGPVRLRRFFNRAIGIYEDICTGFSPMPDWEHALREEANFDYLHVDLKQFNHDHRIVLEEIERLTVAFDSAAFCEFGFCKKRLEHCNQAVIDICIGLKKGTCNIDEMDRLLVKKKIFIDERGAAA